MFGTKLLLEKPQKNREFFSEGLISGFSLSRASFVCVRDLAQLTWRASRTLLLEKINCSKPP